jgi:hypothetical protein
MIDDIFLRTGQFSGPGLMFVSAQVFQFVANANERRREY